MTTNAPTSPVTLKKQALIQEGFSFLDAQGNVTSDPSTATDTVLLQVDLRYDLYDGSTAMFYVVEVARMHLLERVSDKTYGNPTGPPRERTHRLAMKVNLKDDLRTPDLSADDVICIARRLILEATCPKLGGTCAGFPLSWCEKGHMRHGDMPPCGCGVDEMAIVAEWE